MRWAISASDDSVRRRKRNSRIFARMDFSAEGLTAGVNLQNNEWSRVSTGEEMHENDRFGNAKRRIGF